MSIKTCIERLENVSSEIDKLFKELQEPEIVEDGVMSIPIYCSSKYKIFWVLKEAYDEYGYDIRKGILKRIKTESGLTKASKPTFTPIIYTSYGILHNCDWNGISYIENDPSVIDVIECIGLVNIKKTPGGSQSIANELQKAYDQHGHIVIKQIAGYDPDIIIFGGTSHYLTNDLELSNEVAHDLAGIKYWIKNNKLFIQAYHPNQRGNQQEYCDGIINVVRYWEKSKNIG